MICAACDGTGAITYDSVDTRNEHVTREQPCLACNGDNTPCSDDVLAAIADLMEEYQ